MSSEDIIRLWKDPVDDPAADHPAGRIDLNHLGSDPAGGTDTAEICVSIAISIAASDLIHCADSIMHGSCGAFSVGCCKATQ